MTRFSPWAVVPPVLLLLMVEGWWLVRRSYFGTADEYKKWRRVAKFVMVALASYSFAVWGLIAYWFIAFLIGFKGY
jgi:hypothetical protein